MSATSRRKLLATLCCETTPAFDARAIYVGLHILPSATTGSVGRRNKHRYSVRRLRPPAPRRERPLGAAVCATQVRLCVGRQCTCGHRGDQRGGQESVPCPADAVRPHVGVHVRHGACRHGLHEHEAGSAHRYELPGRAGWLAGKRDRGVDISCELTASRFFKIM